MQHLNKKTLLKFSKYCLLFFILLLNMVFNIFNNNITQQGIATVYADDINNILNSADALDDNKIDNGNLNIKQGVSKNRDDKTKKDVIEHIVASDDSNKDIIGNVLLQAMSLMGIAYKWGGNTPEAGMDCSGFIRYVFKKSLGITLPRTAREMSKIGKKIPLEEIQAGDLIFFNTRRGSNTHIGMYIGNNQFIQSPNTGSQIQITNLVGYWRNHINGVKRIVKQDTNADGTEVIDDYQDITNEQLPSTTRVANKKHHNKHKKNNVVVKSKNKKQQSNIIKKTASKTINKTKSKTQKQRKKHA